jgi:hypothetical protein
MGGRSVWLVLHGVLGRATDVTVGIYDGRLCPLVVGPAHGDRRARAARRERVRPVRGRHRQGDVHRDGRGPPADLPRWTAARAAAGRRLPGARPRAAVRRIERRCCAVPQIQRSRTGGRPVRPHRRARAAAARTGARPSWVSVVDPPVRHGHELARHPRLRAQPHTAVRQARTLAPAARRRRPRTGTGARQPRAARRRPARAQRPRARRPRTDGRARRGADRRGDPRDRAPQGARGPPAQLAE